MIISTVCLIILGITFQSCQYEAEEMGRCKYSLVNEMAVCYVDDVKDLLARASYYDPEKCDVSPVNCFIDREGNLTNEFLGDGSLTREWYGLAIACPLGLYGKWIDFENAGRWQCRDHGGAIKQSYGTVYTVNGWVTGWFVTFDFLLHEPEWWTYGLLEIRSIE